MTRTDTTKPLVHAFFHDATNTISYLVADPATKRAAVIDPVLDYDQDTGKYSVGFLAGILEDAASRGYTIDWVLETHVHADHLSGAPYIKIKTGARVAIGERVREVQKIFRPVFNAIDVSGEGAEFDHLFTDTETFSIGNLQGQVLATPGHTPACVSYLIGDAVFAGDTIFMPDYGTARADFPGGDARALYRSIQRLMQLPPETRLFVCHDYLPAAGRDQYAWETTVGEELARNVHIGGGATEEDFVALRTGRDKSLAAPALLMPSIQVNMRAGHMPPAEPDGVHYLKIPVRLA
jgi:glyoxylase-like metal-dependent hydrolase (beta-lactamase superfamily II)